MKRKKQAAAKQKCECSHGNIPCKLSRMSTSKCTSEKFLEDILNVSNKFVQFQFILQILLFF